MILGLTDVKSNPVVLNVNLYVISVSSNRNLRFLSLCVFDNVYEQLVDCPEEKNTNIIIQWLGFSVIFKKGRDTMLFLDFFSEPLQSFLKAQLVEEGRA